MYAQGPTWSSQLPFVDAWPLPYRRDETELYDGTHMVLMEQYRSFRIQPNRQHKSHHILPSLDESFRVLGERERMPPDHREQQFIFQFCLALKLDPVRKSTKVIA